MLWCVDDFNLEVRKQGKGVHPELKEGCRRLAHLFVNVSPFSLKMLAEAKEPVEFILKTPRGLNNFVLCTWGQS